MRAERREQDSPRTTKDNADRVRLRKQLLEVQQLEGKLVDRDHAVRHVQQLANAERDAWLMFPRKAAGAIAAALSVDARDVEAALEKAVRDELNVLAEVRVDL